MVNSFHVEGACAQAGLPTVFPDRPQGDGSSYDGMGSLRRRGAKKESPWPWADRAASALGRKVGSPTDTELVVNWVSFNTVMIHIKLR